MKSTLLKLMLISLPVLAVSCSTPNNNTAKTENINRKIASVSERILCGVRQGTAGNAFLVADVDRNEEELTLGVQGGDQNLLEKLDRLIPNGSQNGERYCVVAQTNGEEVVDIVSAVRVQRRCGIRVGTGGEAALVKSLQDPHVSLTLAMQGSSQVLLEEIDALIPGGTQNGQRYCAEVQFDQRRNPIKIVAAQPN